jgi:hypothetical protein
MSLHDWLERAILGKYRVEKEKELEMEETEALRALRVNREQTERSLARLEAICAEAHAAAMAAHPA